MSDARTPGSPEPRRTAGTAAGVREEAADMAGRTRQEAAATGSRLKEEAIETGTRLKEEAAGAVADVKEAAGEVVSAAGDRATALLDEQREAGAAQGRAFAGAAHRAADQFAEVSPSLARTMHDAAEALDGVTRSLVERSPGEILREVEAYARRQPAVFFGAAALAGFALVRFARSSAPDGGAAGHARAGAPARPDDPGRRPAVAGRAPGWIADPPRRADDRPGDGHPGGAPPTARPATMAAATLGGSAAMRGAPPPSGLGSGVGTGGQGAPSGAMGGQGASPGTAAGRGGPSGSAEGQAAPSGGTAGPGTSAATSRPGTAAAPDPVTRPATLGAPPSGPL